MTSVSSKLSQKDYLKKYLSGGADGKKKKKKKLKGPDPALRAKVKVIDDDVDISKLQPLDESALDLYELNEDAPQIAGIVDERPADVKALDQYKQGQRWKVLSNSDGDGVSVSMSGVSKRAESVSSVEVEEEFIVKPNAQDRKSDKKSRDTDISPPRRKRQEESDESPPRKRRQDDSDVSPPRKKVQNDSDASPPRKKRCDDSDESPPRSKRQLKNHSDSMQKQHDKSFNSSCRKRHQNDSDVSPPRRKQHKDSCVSPPRRGRNYGNEKSPPRTKRQDDSDTSPPRKRLPDTSHKKVIQAELQYDSDASPPRRSNKRYSEDQDNSRSKIRQGKDDHGKLEGKMRKTLDGKAAGLQDAKNLKRELQEFKQREEKVFQKMDDSLSGRGAAVVQRDRKTGLKRDLQREQAEQRVKDEKENKSKEKYTRWGKGLKQTEDQQNRLESDLYEMSKPLARYADDADLDTYFRDQDREGDPMLEYLKNKNKDEAKAKVPVYQGSFPPNRYNIRPGYRWDGVDRSGGYEKKWFEAKNAKKAVEEEAYKWSTSDM